MKALDDEGLGVERWVVALQASPDHDPRLPA